MDEKLWEKPRQVEFLRNFAQIAVKKNAWAA